MNNLIIGISLNSGDLDDKLEYGVKRSSECHGRKEEQHNRDERRVEIRHYKSE